jgi:hypothetical protein
MKAKSITVTVELENGGKYCAVFNEYPIDFKWFFNDNLIVGPVPDFYKLYGINNCPTYTLDISINRGQ